MEIPQCLTKLYLLRHDAEIGGIIMETKKCCETCLNWMGYTPEGRGCVKHGATDRHVMHVSVPNILYCDSYEKKKVKVRKEVKQWIQIMPDGKYGAVYDSAEEANRAVCARDLVVELKGFYEVEE